MLGPWAVERGEYTVHTGTKCTERHIVQGFNHPQLGAGASVVSIGLSARPNDGGAQATVWMSEADALFIAASREDVPVLLASVRKLEADLAKERELRNKGHSRLHHALKATEAELEAATARVRELEAAVRWIPVEEALPEMEGYVLIYTHGKFPEAHDNTEMALFAADEFLSVSDFSEYGGRHAPQGVTHWRELPTPPEVSDAT